jgi:hypothetical protein
MSVELPFFDVDDKELLKTLALSELVDINEVLPDVVKTNFKINIVKYVMYTKRLIKWLEFIREHNILTEHIPEITDVIEKHLVIPDLGNQIDKNLKILAELAKVTDEESQTRAKKIHDVNNSNISVITSYASKAFILNNNLKQKYAHIIYTSSGKKIRTKDQIYKDILSELGTKSFDKSNMEIKTTLFDKLHKKLQIKSIPHETLERILRCLLSLLYMTDYSNKQRREFFQTVLRCFYYYSISKIIPSYTDNSNKDEIDRNLLINFMNKNSKFCVNGRKSNINLILSVHTSNEAFFTNSSIVKNTPVEFLNLIDECNDLTSVLGLGIYFVNKGKSGGHANSLIIDDKKIYRLEPNIYPQGKNMFGYFKDTTINGYKLSDIIKEKGIDADDINNQLNVIYNATHFKTGKYVLNIDGEPVEFEEYVNSALYKFINKPEIKDEGYTFEGFYPEDNYFCTGAHGGLCNTIAVVQIFKKNISLFDLKYYIVNFCSYLYKKATGREFIIHENNQLFIDIFSVINSGEINLIEELVIQYNDGTSKMFPGPLNDFTKGILQAQFNFKGVSFEDIGYMTEIRTFLKGQGVSINIDDFIKFNSEKTGRELVERVLSKRMGRLQGRLPQFGGNIKQLMKDIKYLIGLNKT